MVRKCPERSPVPIKGAPKCSAITLQCRNTYTLTGHRFMFVPRVAKLLFGALNKGFATLGTNMNLGPVGV